MYDSLLNAKKIWIVREINRSNVASQLKFVMKILILVAKNLPATSKYIVWILRQVAQKELLANLNPQLTGNQT